MSGTRKICHIVNPVVVGKDSDLLHAQPITYETMRIAKRFAKKQLKGKLEIDLCATVYPEDEGMISGGFTRINDLTEAVCDSYDFTSKYRKLPYMREIIKNAREVDCDYIIQTNVDIGLLPHFYVTVNRLIDQGYKSFIINKRVISGHYTTLDRIPEMWAEIGTQHNGYDCFVFPRSPVIFDIGDACMGTPWSETTLAVGMVDFWDCKVFKDVHLTFHIGDKRSWMQLADYRKHNTEQFAKVVKPLLDDESICKHEIIEWLLKKLQFELQPHYSQDCHDVCEQTSYLF